LNPLRLYEEREKEGECVSVCVQTHTIRPQHALTTHSQHTYTYIHTHTHTYTHTTTTHTQRERERVTETERHTHTDTHTYVTHMYVPPYTAPNFTRAACRQK